MPEENIGRYKIYDELGRGGMATVFRAYDPRFERDVAIKVLSHAFLHDPQFRARFDREAKTIGTLEHASITPVYDFGEQDGQPYIVMRLMTGGDLSDKLKKGPISLKEIRNIINRLGAALDAAHSKGIVHRDLKPGNVLFDQYENAYLTDFGIARLKETGQSLTGSSIIGTPPYMSPEQIQGEKDIDGRSDQYSLGVILYQMITGEIPYKAETPAKVMIKHILDPVPSLRGMVPDISLEIDLVVQKALSKDPDDRYKKGSDLAAAFETAYLTGEGYSTGQASQPDPQAYVDTASNDPKQLVAEQPTIAVGGEIASVEAPTMVADAPTSQKQGAGKRPTPKWIVPVLGIGFVFIVLAIAEIIGIPAILGAIQSPTTETAAPLVSTDAPTPTEPAPAPTATTIPPTPVPPTATIAVVVDVPTEQPVDIVTETQIPTEIPTPDAPQIPVIGGADKIAFLRDNNIWMANLDGTDLVQLTTDGGAKSNLEWMPGSEGISYITGKCIKSVTIDRVEDIIACFDAVDFLEEFTFSPDGQSVAISLDRQLFIVPYDLETLQSARFRTTLREMAGTVCEFFGPFQDRAILSAFWSADGNSLAVKMLGVGGNGLQVDLVQILDISNCVERPPKLDEFPASRFTIDVYATNPRLPVVDWDGNFLFALHSFKRNDGFGDLYIYNSNRNSGEMINPIDGRCCYRDPQWSPDGRYLIFAFQDILLGANSVTEIYLVQFAAINTGIELIPLPIPPIDDPRDSPLPILRPVPPGD